MLTVVDLNSAPLDQDSGEFSYQGVRVGFGPCSVSLIDVTGLPARGLLTPERSALLATLTTRSGGATHDLFTMSRVSETLRQNHHRTPGPLK